MNLFQKAKAAISNATIPVSISAEMFKTIIQQFNLEDIKQIDVLFDGDTIIVKGKYKKMFILIPFQIVLRPFYSYGRELHLTVVKLSPLNADWLKNKIFHSPPYMKFEESNIKIDLNGFEVIKKIPVGTIRFYEIINQRLVVTMGV